MKEKNARSPSLKANPAALLGRVLRIAVAGVVVLPCFGVIMGRSVYANVKEGALHFGDELSTMRSAAAGDVLGDDYRLHINGQVVSVSNGVSKHGAAYVLQVFEEECKQGADGMVDQLASLQATLDADARSAPGGGGARGFGTVREIRGDRGYVMCFAQGKELTDAEKMKRLVDAVSSGNLGALGDVRYVYAQDSKKGDGARVFAAWTQDGVFDVAKMFPKEGDVPGEDVPGAPRPEGSRRVLAGGAEGAPYGVVVYQANEAPDAILGGVDASLRQAGWLETPLPPELAQWSHGFSRGELDLVVTASAAGDGKSGVSYVYSQLRGHSVSRARAE